MSIVIIGLTYQVDKVVAENKNLWGIIEAQDGLIKAIDQ